MNVRNVLNERLNVEVQEPQLLEPLRLLFANKDVSKTLLLYTILKIDDISLKIIRIQKIICCCHAIIVII